MLVHRFPKLSETFILNQITGLLDAGHEVDIYAAAPGDDAVVHSDVASYDLLARTRYADIPAHPVARVAGAFPLAARSGLWRVPAVVSGALDVATYGRRALSLALLYTAATFHGRDAYDVLHCQFGTLGATALALVDIGATRGRVVVSFRGSDLTMDGIGREYPTLFARADLFMPVCEAFADQLVERGCDPAKIRVHHSGIELDRFRFAERTRRPGEPTELLSVARLEEKKGIAYAVDAVAQLRAEGRDVRYTVIGEGSLRPDLERRIRARGVEDVVELAGAMPHEDVVARLHASHVMLAPSVTASNGDQEGIPNVLKEAMATGMPVVATSHSGIPELVEDGVSGYLVPEKDSRALAARVARLIENPDAWSAMGRAGRARVEDEYEIHDLNRRLDASYRQLAGAE